jgi:glycosyltransferase involved in cell wall biosynthesis
VDRSRVAIIIPALNEERSIASVTAAVTVYGVPIVVSDGSTDGTVEAALAAGAAVVCHQRNQGYDAALNSGFIHADELHAEYAITFDADGQHDPALIPEFIRLLDGGEQVVIGVRPRPARISERVFAAYTRATYGIHDPLCGMKGYRMSLYRMLGHFDAYRSTGTELMLYGVRGGHPFGEVEVPIAPRRGASGFGGALRGNWRILRSLLLGLLPKHRRLA